MPVSILKCDEVITAMHSCGLMCRYRSIIGMDKVHVRPRKQLVERVAEHAFPCRVQSLEVAVETGDAHQVERQREEPVQFLFGALSFHEPPDLCADSGQHLQKLLIGLPDFAAEELHHADNTSTTENRQCEGAVQTIARGNGSSRKVAVRYD